MYSPDEGESWFGPYVISAGDVNASEQDYLNNLSAAFIDEDEIVLSVYVYHDHDIYSSIVEGDRIRILNYYLLWGADGYEDVDTVFEYEVVDEVPEVTGPTLGLRDEGLVKVEIAVWSVGGELYYRSRSLVDVRAEPLSSGVICEGEKPSMDGDVLVYEYGGGIYVRRYEMGLVEDWSEAEYVVSGERPSVRLIGGEAYVYYEGDNGGYVVHGDVGGWGWSEPEEIYEGESRYLSGCLSDVVMRDDTVVPPVGGVGGRHGRRMLAGTIRRYNYVVMTVEEGNKREVVFRRVIETYMPVSMGGPMSREEREGEARVRLGSSVVRGDARLILDVGRDAEVEVKVYDVRGRLVEREEVKVRGGRAEVPVEMRGVGSGVYIYEVDMLGERYRGKFVKVR